MADPQHELPDKTPSPSRQPFTGSCHCGATKYIVYLILPPHAPGVRGKKHGPDGRLLQNFYRCNCTTCIKAGILHIRLPNPAEDFVLLSPLDPLAELGDYTCNKNRLHFLFCKTCGMRCFTFAGEGEVLGKEVPLVSTDGKGEIEERKIWCPRDPWTESHTSYISMNAYSIDAGQEGFDLREWTEKKWVAYLDCLGLPGERDMWTCERPQRGGAY